METFLWKLKRIFFAIAFVALLVFLFWYGVYHGLPFPS